MLAFHRFAPAAASRARSASSLAGPTSQVLSAAARSLLDPAEDYLAHAAFGLREACHNKTRGAQAQLLEDLAQALAPEAEHLVACAQDLALDPQDPARGLVRRRLAAAAQVQVLLTAGSTCLRAHEAGQRLREVPALTPRWREQLCDEAAALLHGLAGSDDPSDHARASLLLASAPGPLRKMLSMESLPVAIHRQASQWGPRHEKEPLSLTHWLALRLHAHPESGTAATLQAQERLLHLDPELAEPTAPLLRDLSRQHVVSVVAAARLPGLGVADISARYHLTLQGAPSPHLDDVLCEGGEWLVGRPLPATDKAPPERLTLPPGAPEPDSLLSLQSLSAQAGPVRALRTDIFQTPQAPGRGHVLLMPGQSFRVAEGSPLEVTLADGRRQQVRCYSLDKVSEEAPLRRR